METILTVPTTHAAPERFEVPVVSKSQTCRSCGGLGVLTHGCRAVQAADPGVRAKMVGEICPVCKGEGSAGLEIQSAQPDQMWRNICRIVLGGDM